MSTELEDIDLEDEVDDGAVIIKCLAETMVR